MWDDLPDKAPPAKSEKKPYKPFFKKKEPEELYKPFVLALNPDMPEKLIPLLEGICKRLNEMGYTVRLGGNKGIEEIAEKMFVKHELHLPWRNFNGKESKSTFNTQSAFAISKQYAPVYDKLPDAVKAILARNVRLILGDKLKSPLLFLITWSNDGVETSKERTIKTGNVGHIISMADALHVPIFNLQNPNCLTRLKDYLRI